MFMQASTSLALREIVRFIRQKNRVIGAMATPVLFWFLLGSGVGRSLVAPGFRERTDYLTYFFPGIVLLIILFTAIFSTVSVIEDRREGFLQGVLVAPDGRSAILFGKLIGGTLLAVFQALRRSARALFGLSSGCPGSFLSYRNHFYFGCGIDRIGFSHCLAHGLNPRIPRLD